MNRLAMAALALGACALGTIECVGALPARDPAPPTGTQWVLTSRDQQAALAHQTQTDLFSAGAAIAFETMASGDDVARWLGPVDAALYQKRARRDGWTRYELDAPQGRPLFALARVELERDDARRPCPRDGAKRRCLPNSWAYVGPIDVTVKGTDEPCIWTHPIDRATIHITYPDVSIPQGQSLALRTALRDSAVSGKGAPINIDVTLPDGARTARHVHREQRGWQTLTLRGPIDGDVSLAVSTPNAGRRHLCHRLEVVP